MVLGSSALSEQYCRVFRDSTQRRRGSENGKRKTAKNSVNSKSRSKAEKQRMTVIFDVLCFSAASVVIRGWKAVAVTEFPPLPSSEPLSLCVAINPSKSLGQNTLVNRIRIPTKMAKSPIPMGLASRRGKRQEETLTAFPPLIARIPRMQLRRRPRQRRITTDSTDLITATVTAFLPRKAQKTRKYVGNGDNGKRQRRGCCFALLITCSTSHLSRVARRKERSVKRRS